jgi:hypothetical protein
LWTVINSRITRTSRQLRRPDSRKNGSAFSEQPSFSGKTVAFPFVRDEVADPASAAKKLSAFFVSALVDRQANYCTVVTREAEMRTALIVATTLAFTIGAQAQTRGTSGGSAQPAGKGRVET